MELFVFNAKPLHGKETDRKRADLCAQTKSNLSIRFPVLSIGLVL
jgi:hypothetical protein